MLCCSLKKIFEKEDKTMKAKIIKLNKRSYVGGSVSIQQCSIYDDVEILGHVFHGLEDIDKHVEMCLC